MDENKQVDHSNQQLDEPIEVKRAMKSDSPSQVNSPAPDGEAIDAVTAQTDLEGDAVLVEEYSNTTPDTTPSVNSTVISDLSQQIESLKIQLEERVSQYMRIAADFENYRRRTSKDKEESEVLIKRNTIIELLPVVDNFERARSQLKPQTEGELTIHKSYQGVYKQLVDSLKRLGVSAMRSEGQEFDPNLHEAVLREPTDQHPEGTVLEELVRGYYLGDRVLRHAMVKVASTPENLPIQEEQSNSVES